MFVEDRRIRIASINKVSEVFAMLIDSLDYLDPKSEPQEPDKHEGDACPDCGELLIWTAAGLVCECGGPK